MVQKNDERAIILALEALKRDPVLSLRKAAKIYSVDYSKLRRRQSGILSRRDISANLTKLTKAEASTIIDYVIDLDSRAFPPRISGVEDMANRLLGDRDQPPVGVNWASNFVRRQPLLQTRLNRRIDYQRVQCEDPIQYRNWFRLIRNMVVKWGIDEHDIYNFDETGFTMGIISATGMVVTSANRRQRPRTVQPGNREWATVIQAVGAQGWIVPPYIIVAGKNHLSSWYDDEPFPKDWRIAVTYNGWTDNEQGLNWVKHFDDNTKGRTKGVYRLLVLDGHESHHSTDFELYCKANNIITLCMPAHSSHRLQPLDVGCFGPLKTAYSRQIEDLMRVLITHVDKVQFFQAFRTAHFASMTEFNIRGGFRGAGLVPYDPDSVISKLDIKLTTPSPSPLPIRSSTQEISPWLSKTPQTTTEATSQSDYIKRRVQEHQNSSPTAIYQAIDQIAKATQGTMHKVSLLEDRVISLELANHILSKRRRVKKTRIQEGGSLNLIEVQDLKDQRDVEQQLRQETRQNRGRQSRGVVRERRCGTCQKPGHDRRNCPEVIRLSEESSIECS